MVMHRKKQTKCNCSWRRNETVLLEDRRDKSGECTGIHKESENYGT
jgi:hypothetical protein